MKTATVKEYSVSIYISGQQQEALRVLREECLREGLCVTVEPLLFIYTGGEEAGVRVRLTNYPRFPVENRQLWSRAESIAMLLLEKTFQHSVLLQDGDTTKWITKREQ
jgi:hypothetical protein